MPLVVRFKGNEPDTELKTISVKIDYQNDKVHFDPIPSDCGELDLVALEQLILDYFKPPHVEIPDVYYENLSKIQELKSTSYATSFMNEYNNNGDKNDSRQS